MTDRTATLLIMVAGVAVMANTMGPKVAPHLIWNASESVPTGLYHVQPAHQLTVTTLVVAYPPEPLATYLADGGYLPRGVPLIKRILALPGQTVCRTGLTITVNGIDVGAARERDRRGRPLPAWQGCGVIAAWKVFLVNPEEPASLDGRYFGPIPLSSIIGRADLLWTFDKD
jgi:conjugative transfer signal peptidase TraF